MVRKLGLAIALVAVVCESSRGDDAKLPFTISKETTGITSPLREEGTVDYVAALNQRYGTGMKPEENLVVSWLKATGTGSRVLPEDAKASYLKLCGGKENEGPKWVVYWEFLRDGGMEYNTIGRFVGEEIKARGRLWSETDFPKLAEYLEARKDYLDAVTEALARPKYWSPIVAPEGDGKEAMFFSVAGFIRETMGVAGERATLRMKGGDFEGFVSACETIVHASRLMQSGATKLERSHGLTTIGMVSRMIGAAAGSGSLTEAQCARLWKLLDKMGPTSPMEESLDVDERWMALDRAQLLATGKINLLESSAQRFSWMRYSGWSSIDAEQVDWNQAMKAINTLVDARMASIKKASVKELLDMERTWDSEQMTITRNPDGSKLEKETREEYSNRIGRLMLELSAGTWPRMELTQRETELQRSMAKVMVGVAAYHAEKNKWPDKLSDLVPEFTKELPKDIYSEGEKAEILYAKGDDGVRVYSVGLNGKDDGGTKDDPYLGGTGADDIVIGAGVDSK